jgi:hypothetical protein
VKSQLLVYLCLRGGRRYLNGASAGLQNETQKTHTTVWNQLNDSTLTKIQTLMTFLTVRVSASYKNFYLVTQALSTSYQQPFSACPCACAIATLGERKMLTREKVQLM